MSDRLQSVGIATSLNRQVHVSSGVVLLEVVEAKNSGLLMNMLGWHRYLARSLDSKRRLR